LLIFDEIQECPNAIAALKFFCENNPDIHIIAAGSLLGVFLHPEVSFPVGKVEFLHLYPLSFYEFLLALGENGLCELLDKKDEKLISVFRDKFIDKLKTYFFVGGMPEVVQCFVNEKDFAEARRIQEQILESYLNDFSKHIPPAQIQKVKQIWNAVPALLAKENKKFMYKEVQKGASAKTYEAALEWLENSGLIHQVFRVSKPGVPLKSYEDKSAFKIYSIDIGLLSAMSFLNAKIILEGDSMFTEFKGALAEQFALQELKAAGVKVAYWVNEGASAEVDFLLQTMENGIVPLEVKASTNLKAKSLKVYNEKFSPKLMLRASLAGFAEHGVLKDVPLYAITFFIYYSKPVTKTP
jgi:predicted AAA+ superfamily ATPase